MLVENRRLIYHWGYGYHGMQGEAHVKAATPRKLGWPRIVAATIGLLLIVLAWWHVLGATRGLTVVNSTRDGVPLRFVAPEGEEDLPGVVVAHGFAGSRQLMLTYAYTLARAGYGVMLLDFDGHGANGASPDREAGSLQDNLTTAYQALRTEPAVDVDRISLLGHSMGSGAVMQAAVDEPEKYLATVAVSPTGADVTPDRPRNILFQAGTLEPQFLGNAERLLVAAGGPNDDFRNGLARDLVAVPNVEHISILFSRTSHQAALDWLNRALARPPQSVSADSRIIWYGLHLVGWLVLAIALKPLLPVLREAGAAMIRPPWWWLGLLVAPFLASGILALLSRVVEVGQLGGILVAGTLALWFFIFGLVWLLAGFQMSRPTAGDVAWGLALFALVWVAFGALAQFVWLNWLLIPERLVRWPFLSAAAVPWLLATGIVLQGRTAWQRLGWWLLETVLILAGLGLAIALVPGLGFVLLVMPVIPLVLGIMIVAGSVFERPWSFALGNALFFGWVLAAVFPLA